MLNQSGIFCPAQEATVPGVDLVSYAFENYKQHIDRKIYVDADDPSHFITAGQAYCKIRQIVKGLRSRGLEPGDCVVIHSFNNIAYPLLWFGVIGAGGHVAGSNPAYHSLEVTHHLKITQAKFIVTQTDALDIIQTAAAECSIPKSHIFTLSSRFTAEDKDDEQHNGFQSWRVLCQDGEEDWVSFNDEARAKATIAALGSTSGTTGLPKAAILSHRHFVAQNAMITQSNGERPYHVIQMICLPMFHAFTAQLAFVTPLRNGQTSYYMSRFHCESFLDKVKKYAITDTAIVPPIVTALNALSVEKCSPLQSLRYVLCAGAPLDAKTQSSLYEKLAPEAVIGQVWGVTEMAWITSFTWNERDESGSVGRLLPSTELKILDDDGNAITKDNVHGEAYVRSPSVFNGYLNNVEANREAFRPDHETHKLARSPPRSRRVSRRQQTKEEYLVGKPTCCEKKPQKRHASNNLNGKRSFDEMSEIENCHSKAVSSEEPLQKRQAIDRSQNQATKSTSSGSLSNGTSHHHDSSPFDNHSPLKAPETPPKESSSSSSLSKLRTDDPPSMTKGPGANTWYRTGDIVYVSRGRVFVSGRCKEIIKVRGWQVSPSELESILIVHQGIDDVAVKGVEIEGKGEVPRAFIVKADRVEGHALSENEVKSFLEEKVVGFKRLDGGVRFIEKIPRNPTGKILRRLLKD